MSFLLNMRIVIRTELLKEIKMAKKVVRKKKKTTTGKSPKKS